MLKIDFVSHPYPACENYFVFDWLLNVNVLKYKVNGITYVYAPTDDA